MCLNLVYVPMQVIHDGLERICIARRHSDSTASGILRMELTDGLCSGGRALTQGLFFCVMQFVALFTLRMQILVCSLKPRVIRHCP